MEIDKKLIAGIVLTLRDIIIHDATLSIDRIIKHMKTEYDIIITKDMIEEIIQEAKEALKKQ